MADFLNNPDFQRAKSVFEFKVLDLTGQKVMLQKYKGHVCLFVNIASKSKYIEQYVMRLNRLHDKFHEKGLRILAFPCNQFGEEEPGTREEIAAWVQEAGLKFDVFDKVDVNTKAASPVWKFLKHIVRHPGEERYQVIKWNFNMFTTNRRGVPQHRFGFESTAEEVSLAVQGQLEVFK